MAKEIQSIIVPGKDGRKYSVGDTVNGQVIDKIEDRTIEYPDSIHFYYIATDFRYQSVVEFVEVPMIVEFKESMT